MGGGEQALLTCWALGGISGGEAKYREAENRGGSASYYLREEGLRPLLIDASEEEGCLPGEGGGGGRLLEEGRNLLHSIGRGRGRRLIVPYSRHCLLSCSYGGALNLLSTLMYINPGMGGGGRLLDTLL